MRAFQKLASSPGRWGWALGCVVAMTGAASGQVIIRVSAAAKAGGDGASWKTAFSDLQTALNAAAPIAGKGTDVQVWVASGVYTPTARTIADEPGSATFQLINRVAIYGGFTGTEKNLAQRNHGTNHTTLSGMMTSWHVVTGSGVDSSAVLDGLTIEEGLGGFGFPKDSENGAGMVIIDGSPRVIECVFRANRTSVFGARGAAVFNRGGSPRFEGCMFEMNVAEFGDGGAFASFTGGPMLVACRFMDNGADFGGGALAGAGFIGEDCLFLRNIAEGGGALYGSGRFRGCVFDDNDALQTGGAVLVSFAQAGCTFTECRFVRNEGDIDAGAIMAGEPITATSCVFAQNRTMMLGSAVSGMGSFTNCVFNGNVGAAALYMIADGVRATNCTFVGNEGGGVIYDAPGTMTIDNSVFWNNRFDGIADETAQIFVLSGQVDVERSYIQGLTGNLGGEGNIGGKVSPDPLLVDADGEDNVPGTMDDDLRLAPGSACIDAGDNAAMPADVFDLDEDGDVEEQLPLDAAAQARRLDDPETSDSGEGDGAIVDMGAYEFQGPPVCTADWNQDGTLDSRDFFAFINAFFMNNADFNADGATNFQDFFDYVSAFFAGCAG